MARHGYIMHDQTRHKIQSIMRDPHPEGPLLTHPRWVAVTLLVVALNVMVMLPPLA